MTDEQKKAVEAAIKAMDSMLTWNEAIMREANHAQSAYSAVTLGLMNSAPGALQRARTELIRVTEATK